MPNSLSQPIFILLGIFAFGFAVAKSPQIITSLIGSNTAMSDSIGNLMSFGMATNLAKIGECYLKTTLASGKLFIKKIQVDPTCLDGLIQHLNK